MKVHYPIKTEKLNELDTSSKYGNYLIGSNNTWHGGIHVERKDEEIRAIADGRIIAYRFMDTYKEVSKTENSTGANKEEIEETNQYSNCFVLIQHDFELKKTVEEGEGDKKTTKEEKKYVTFYSLYNHLLPVAEMNDKSLVPDMMATTKLKVIENEGFIYPKKTIKGLNARKLSSGNNVVKGSTGVKFVIPYGELVTKQFDSSNKLIELDGYTKIEYNGKYGYIYAKGNRIVDLGTQFKIATQEDKKIIEDKSGVPDDKKDLKGARVRKTGQGSEIVDIIPKDEEVIVEEKKGNWYKIKGYEGYSHKNNFEIKKLVDESKITKDAIIACDLPIKAGDGIGYTGLVQLSNGKNTEDYYATHVEVFMGDETEDFLNNTFDAGNDKKDYILLKEGTKLKKEITQKVNLKKNLPIKIVDIKRIYVKIKENREEAEGIVKLSEVTYQGKITDPKTNTARDYYTINKASFNAVNTKFKNKLPKEETVHLFWVNRVDSNGNTVSKKDEKKLQDSEKYRKLRYTPVNSANEYWVEAKDIMPTVEYVEVEREKRVPKKLSTWERIKDYVVDVEKYETKKVKVCEPKKLPLKRGEKTVTSNAITKVYLAIPENKNDVDEELCKDVVVNISKLEKIRVTKDTEYIKVECTYPMAKEKHTQQGWVLTSDLNIEKNAFSAYNWDKFSFKPVKGGNEYMYDIQGLREAEKTNSAFIKEVWKSLDLNSDGKIELGEVQKAYSILETRNQLTKLVCQHKNEWSYTGDELAGEIEKYFDYFINHKDTEEHTKKDYKALKKKKLDVLKEQAKELMFWKEASKRSAAVTLEKKMEKDNSGTLKPKGIESLDKSIEASKTENTEQKSGTVSIEERAKDENGFLDLMKLGIELKKEEERKEEPKKEEKNPKPERTFPSTENVYHFHPIAFVNHMKKILGTEINADILFPLKNKPTNDKLGIHKAFYWGDKAEGHQATFKSNRKGGRKHAGRDLYTHPYSEVVSMCAGKVLTISKTFADGTGAITVLHESEKGKKFIARYGEIENSTVKVRVNEKIVQGQLLGKTGNLRTWYKNIVKGYEVYMLHLEIYDGSEGFDLKKQLSNSVRPFKRRADLIDSLELLKGAYEETFERISELERIDIKNLKTSQKGIDFIKKWESLKLKAYNDSEGYCTIGYGHLIEKKKCEKITIPSEFKNGITKERAEELFKEDLMPFEEALKNEIKVPLHQYEFDALVSLLFNAGASFLSVGGANKGDTKIKKYINQSKYIEGANEMIDVNNGGNFGLTRRRQAEINIFKNNIYESKY